MTRRETNEGLWPRGANGGASRWRNQSIPLSEVTEHAPPVPTTEPPPAAAPTSGLLLDLERLESVVHDFLACLNRMSHARGDGAGSAQVARFRSILEAPPPTGSPLLGPPVLCGMSPMIGLESLFGFVGTLRKTGVLRIHAGGTTFMISVVRGDVVHGVCHPRPEAELLGNILVERGAIDRATLDRFFARCGPSSCQIGEALEREELVSTDELREALELQLQRLFDRLLAAHSSDWCFHEGEAKLSYVNLRMNATSVLLESARKRDERNA